MDYFLFAATVSLIVQLAIISLWVAGFEAKRKVRFLLHGLIMLAAFAAHLVAISIILVQSLVIGIVPKISLDPHNDN